MSETESSAALRARRQFTAGRHKARHYAVQALYQWSVSGGNLGDIETQFGEDFDFSGTDREYFHELLHGIPAALSEIESDFSPYLDIALEKLGTVERAVLRIGTYELRVRIEIPYRVAINEAVSLTKKFGAAESHKFVNGVLDKVARKLRPEETSRR